MLLNHKPEQQPKFGNYVVFAYRDLDIFLDIIIVSAAILGFTFELAFKQLMV